ncbi:hypothetical protein [Polyangium jinanense]|uniref:Uncharacterized protein n=1 Tax=Polyangium jinanense TaxID=2829994 RepID=A0A9X3X674_9BACT|nr:hypothetical protein [Polyangium jinanense]MDC3984509.1 hypothetical protein [Polyangium jinanense]
MRAALAEGFALDEVLGVEGIKAQAWKKADVAWKKKLAGDPALFGKFGDELARAEDWLGRRVKPLEDDPAAWVSFLHAYTKSADPIGLLAGAGLGLNDVARLERRWARRFEEDASIGKKLAELARAPRGLPRIEVEPKVLRRSRVAEGRLAAEATAVKASDDGPTSVVRRRWLEAHRGVLRGLAEKAVQVEPDVAPSPAPLRLPPLPQPGGVEALQATSLALDVPRGPALPFVDGAPPLTASVPEPKPARTAESLSGTALVVDVPRGPALPFAGSEGAVKIQAEGAVQKAPSSLGLAETSLALDVPRGPALPFQAGAKAAVSATKGAGLDETAPVVAVPRGPALPFGEGRGVEAPRELEETAPVVAVPRGPALPFGEGRGVEVPRELGETAPVVAVPRGPALPFGEEPPGQKGAAAGNAKELPGAQGLAATAPITGMPKVEALPFMRELASRKGDGKDLERDFARTVAFELPADLRKPTRETAEPERKVPELSLERYAALCAELAAARASAEETFARYGLGERDARKAVDDVWKERLARAPALYQEWNRLYLRAQNAIRGRR